MATILKLKSDIKKLNAALKSKGLTETFKNKVKTQLEKAQNELESMQKGGKPRKVSTTKGTKSTLDALKSKIKSKKYGVYKGAGVDLKKDADRPAKPIGKRKSKNGNTYYEYRANRIDVKQPPKRYPKLEKGGDLDNWKAPKEIYSGKDIQITIPKMGKFDEQKVVAVYDKENFIFKIYDKDKKRVLTKMGGSNFESNLMNGSYKMDGYMAKGGELKVREDFKYQNTAKRWLDDHDGTSLAYKVAVLLLKGDNNPDETLNIDYERYTRVLRSLDSISESKHEMAWRTENYSQAEAQNWAKETVSNIFELNDTDKLAKGGKIKNQYEGKTAEKVWEQWTEEQRSHFLLDHSELLDRDRLENNLGYSRTIQKDKKYEDLTPHTKRVLESHVGSGQYAKGGYFAKGGKTKMPEWAVTITSEDGDSYDWDGFAKSEDDALYKAEQEAGFDSVESSVIMITDENGEKIEYAKGGKLKIGSDDFSFLLELSDNELSKRLDLVREQQKINGQQYLAAFNKKESTQKIEDAGEKLANQERAIIEARLIKYDKRHKMAKGGMLEHGLKVGDTITFEKLGLENEIEVKNKYDDKKYVVDLDKGTRTEWIGSFKDRRKYAEKGAYMEMGGETKNFDKSVLDELVNDSVYNLWKGYNYLEQAINYLGRTGQTGAINSFKQKVGFESLEDAINKVDMANSKFANGGELHRNEQ